MGPLITFTNQPWTPSDDQRGLFSHPITVLSQRGSIPGDGSRLVWSILTLLGCLFLCLLFVLCPYLHFWAVSFFVCHLFYVHTYTFWLFLSLLFVLCPYLLFGCFFLCLSFVLCPYLHFLAVSLFVICFMSFFMCELTLLFPQWDE